MYFIPIQVLMSDLSLSPSDMNALYLELRDLRKDCAHARLILGAFLGRPLLVRRRCADVCAAFENLIRKERKREKRIKEYEVRFICFHASLQVQCDNLNFTYWLPLRNSLSLYLYTLFLVLLTRKSIIL